MAILSAIFSYVSVTLLRHFKITDFAYRILILFFAFYPANPVYGFTATKDVLFAGFFLLSITLLLQLLYTDAPHKKRLWAAFVGATVLMMLFRNNAPYAFALFVLLALIFFKHRALVAKLLVLPLVLAVVLSNLLIVAFDAERPQLREALSVPLQQIAAAVNYNADEITEDELETVYEVLTPEGISEYVPYLSDNVKFTFDTDTFLADPMKYVAVYLRLGVKCPVTYINAFLDLSWRYCYPCGNSPRSFLDFHYRWVSNLAHIDEVDLYPGIRTRLEGVFRTGYEQFPLAALLLNIGFLTWLLSFCVAYFAHQKDHMYTPFILCFCLLFTLLFGPVADTRYYYAFMLCVPVLLALLFRRGKTLPLQISASIKLPKISKK